MLMLSHLIAQNKPDNIPGKSTAGITTYAHWGMSNEESTQSMECQKTPVFPPRFLNNMDFIKTSDGKILTF